MTKNGKHMFVDEAMDRHVLVVAQKLMKLFDDVRDATWPAVGVSWPSFSKPVAMTDWRSAIRYILVPRISSYAVRYTYSRTSGGCPCSGQPAVAAVPDWSVARTRAWWRHREQKKRERG